MLHSRIDRIQSLIQSEVAQIIDRELNNPRLPDFITVWGVKVSKDLSHALVFITFLQDQSDDVIKDTIIELNKSAGFINRLIAKRITLKRHPHVKFIYTDSTKVALDMEHLFQQIKREDAEQGYNGGDNVDEETEEK